MEKTNLVLAKVLSLAMDNGVSHWSLGFSDLGLSEDYATYFFPCIEWLEAEGLIRVGEYARTMGGLANGSIENVSLSARGMAVLGQDIVVDGKNGPLSDTIKDVSAGRADFSKIGDVIGGILGGLIKSMSG